MQEERIHYYIVWWNSMKKFLENDPFNYYVNVFKKYEDVLKLIENFAEELTNDCDEKNASKDDSKLNHQFALAPIDDKNNIYIYTIKHCMIKM